MKNLFITIEGVDGSGKSSITDLLAHRLNGVKIVTPSKLLAGKRKVIEEKSSRSEKYEFYYASLVSQQVEIIEALAIGHTVCDRYIHSTVAYQWQDEVPIPNINSFGNELIMPDYAFLLTVCPLEAERRIKERELATKIIIANDHDILMQKRVILRFFEMNDLIKIDTTNKPLENICNEIIGYLRIKN
jgi:thymidylate kinase